MTVSKGPLHLTKKKIVQVKCLSRKGILTPHNVSKGEISQSLLDKIEEWDGKEVEFDLVGGQPKQVREPGREFVPPHSTSGRSNQRGGRARRGVRGHSGRGGKGQSGGGGRHGQGTNRNGGAGNRPPDFHNPYNFVPAPPRDTKHIELGDHKPVDQSTFNVDRYSGEIRVKMVVKTPLLVPDTERVREANNGHKTYPLRCGKDGKPLIPASSIRGMLRSAYETITNSRFGTFSKEFKKKLEYRESTRPYQKTAHPKSAWDLLPKSLHPATSLDQLSPADRVFGWVNAEKGTDAAAVRGLLRVGAVTCESSAADSVESFGDGGVPLAILAAPKPQQVRFYVAKNPQGEAQDDGISKPRAGYTTGKGLRGRKVYPHHRSLPPGHWDNPIKDRTQEGARPANGSRKHYQEYRRPRAQLRDARNRRRQALQEPQEQRDDQNRSILGWVKPGAEFVFTINVLNLSAVELGALVWLLSLPKKRYLRYGGGKPLGFGSVKITIDSCDVHLGEGLRDRYAAWDSKPTSANPLESSKQAFESALLAAYPPERSKSFADISFIQAFLVACLGFDLPIHYPRATKNGAAGPPSPAGESFRWFVKNENGGKLALRDLHNEKGLPTLRD